MPYNWNMYPICEGSKRGEAPLFIFLPLSFEGEGERGGEVDK
jgi:hypothetical protein